MGRTIPTFSMAIEHEKRRWKPFRNALYEKSDKKDFDKKMLILFLVFTTIGMLQFCTGNNALSDTDVNTTTSFQTVNGVYFASRRYENQS